jgi:hypothetical protein
MAGKLWGYWVAVGLLVINLPGSVVNTIPGNEPRAAIGIFMVWAILAYLVSKQVQRNFFNSGEVQ